MPKNPCKKITYKNIKTNNNIDKTYDIRNSVDYKKPKPFLIDRLKCLLMSTFSMNSVFLEFKIVLFLIILIAWII